MGGTNNPYRRDRVAYLEAMGLGVSEISRAVPISRTAVYAFREDAEYRVKVSQFRHDIRQAMLDRVVLGAMEAHEALRGIIHDHTAYTTLAREVGPIKAGAAVRVVKDSDAIGAARLLLKPIEARLDEPPESDQVQAARQAADEIDPEALFELVDRLDRSRDRAILDAE